MKRKLVCGMEVHAELKTKSKMFCGCKNDPFGAAQPNMYTCPVCLGLPGALPVANKTAIEWTIKLGLALNCKINLFSKFDRKNYFYPDLPKAYQISQYDLPFCYDGYIDTSYGRIGITRIHLEEDTGKLQHKEIPCGEWNPDCQQKGKHTHKVSLIDFNRSSVPLIEIVTEPDITSPEQAKEYGKKLRQIIRYLEIGDCDMEQGGMRLEANISLMDENTQNLPNYKVEVKNINSFRFVEQAIKFEIDRQSKILDKGKTPIQETRGWNPNTSKTFSQRTKEEAEDYRYFPDPDLPPVRLTEAEINKLKSELIELPETKIKRWQTEFKIEPRFGEMLAEEKPVADFCEQVFILAKKDKLDPNKIASDIVNKKIKVDFSQLKSKPNDIINHFKQMNQTDDVSQEEITSIIKEVIAENPKEVAAYQNGKEALINFFVGQTMKKLKKKIDHKQLIVLLKNMLRL